MTFSRRGLLFSPYKLKRTYDYFSLPVTIPSEKQSKNSKLLKLGSKIFKKLKDFLKELLFPEARINISPCEPLPDSFEKSQIEDYPFFEDPKPPKKRKKPPPDSVIFEKREKSRSTACQTEFMLSIKDFSPSFAFYRDKDRTTWLENLEETVLKEQENSEKVSRKVLRKVIRRNLDLVQCSEVQVLPVKPMKNHQESEVLMDFADVFMDFDYSSKNELEGQETESSEKSGIRAKSEEIKEMETFPEVFKENGLLDQASRTKNIFDNCENQTFASQSLSMTLAVPEPVDQNSETTKKQSFIHPEVKKIQTVCDSTSNPFLNTSLIPKVEVSYKFGANSTPSTFGKVALAGFSHSCNPFTVEKSSFPGFSQSHKDPVPKISISSIPQSLLQDTHIQTPFPKHSQSLNPTTELESKLIDIEMSTEPIKAPEASNSSIATPNLQKTCLFTQNNLQDLYKTPSMNPVHIFPNNSTSTPSLFPSLSQSSPLFQMPSFSAGLTESCTNPGLFQSKSLLSSPSPVTGSGQFKLGKIFSKSKN